jgi:serine/threonine protein phosphatase PrpC
MTIKPILLSVAGNQENQDRGLVLFDGTRTLLCVADGAGGLSGGLEAAIMATEFLRRNFSQLANSEDCAELLRRMDAAIAKDSHAGETTVASAIVTPNEIFGASVGDSGVWLIPPNASLIDLSAGQQRKPFIGSGSAWPVAFHRPKSDGVLLLATDGLLKYTSADRIIETCRRNPTELAPQQLIDLVKYPSGRFPDDVTLILAKI